MDTYPVDSQNAYVLPDAEAVYPQSLLDDVLNAIRTLCQRRDWRLLSLHETSVTAAEFAQRVMSTVYSSQPGRAPVVPAATSIERAVIQEYCKLLHKAVGMDHSAAQQRALIEIWNYITPVIRRYLGHGPDAEDCANEALASIWDKHDQVRDPGRFLGWAGTVACNRARQMLRKTGTAVNRVSNDIDELNEITASDEQPLLAATVIDPATAAIENAPDIGSLRWERLVRGCLKHVPRQAQVFIEVVLNDQTVQEAARNLQMSAGNVYVLKSRAIKKLRTCRELLNALRRALATDVSGAAS